VGGYQIGRDLVVRAPQELSMPFAVNLDPEVLHASYQGFLQGPSHEIRDRLRITNRWLVKAWRNTSDLDWDDRIFMLKTAFEALTGESQAAPGAEALKWIYDEFKRRRHVTSLSTRDLLWSPTERRCRIRRWTDRTTGKEKEAKLTNLEHWYCAFADARNTIVHEGIIPPLVYRAKGSAYEGHFFHVGERLLRETIKVLFDEHGYPDLWRTTLSRAISRGLERLGIQDDLDMTETG
jgi:hypothetical protein